MKKDNHKRLHLFAYHHAGLSCPTNDDDVMLSDDLGPSFLANNDDNAMLSDDPGPSSLANNDVDVAMGIMKSMASPSYIILDGLQTTLKN